MESLRRHLHPPHDNDVRVYILAELAPPEASRAPLVARQVVASIAPATAVRHRVLRFLQLLDAGFVPFNTSFLFPYLLVRLGVKVNATFVVRVPQLVGGLDVGPVKLEGRSAVASSSHIRVSRRFAIAFDYVIHFRVPDRLRLVLLGAEPRGTLDSVAAVVPRGDTVHLVSCAKPNFFGRAKPNFFGRSSEESSRA